MKETESVEEKQDPQYFFMQATAQNNQFRIGLIAIAVGMAGFLANELNSTLNLSARPFHLAALASTLSCCIVGLAGWKFSARMFYKLGHDAEGNRPLMYRTSNRIQTICDFLLPILLSVSALLSLMYIVWERKP